MAGDDSFYAVAVCVMAITTFPFYGHFPHTGALLQFAPTRNGSFSKNDLLIFTNCRPFNTVAYSGIILTMIASLPVRTIGET
jgi:hypothetical protein